MVMGAILFLVGADYRYYPPRAALPRSHSTFLSEGEAFALVLFLGILSFVELMELKAVRRAWDYGYINPSSLPFFPDHPFIPSLEHSPFLKPANKVTLSFFYSIKARSSDSL